MGANDAFPVIEQLFQGLYAIRLTDYGVIGRINRFDPVLVEYLVRPVLGPHGRKCVIGAHLHPWVNPPHDEIVCNYNSYPGNLPEELEKEKLHRLTETIADQFGERPIVYKAGRYGVGFNTSSVLEDLGYEIDTSVLSRTDLSDEEGPKRY